MHALYRKTLPLFFILLCITTLLFSRAAYANNNSAQYFDNPVYVGVVAGFARNATKFINQMNNNGQGQYIDYVHTNGFLGGFLAGLQAHDKHFYIAGEIFYFLNTVPLLNHAINNDIVQRAGVQSGIALHVLPGVMVTDRAVIFGELGVERDHFGCQMNHIVESNKSVTGVDVGIGGRISINQITAVRVQYEHVFFSNIPVIGSLFNRARTKSDRVELIITVTPHIIRDTSGEE